MYLSLKLELGARAQKISIYPYEVYLMADATSKRRRVKKFKRRRVKKLKRRRVKNIKRRRVTGSGLKISVQF